MTSAVRTILLLGSGGREHALAWKMAQSPDIKCIYALPGSDVIHIATHAVLLRPDPARYPSPDS